VWATSRAATYRKIPWSHNTHPNDRKVSQTQRIRLQYRTRNRTPFPNQTNRILKYGPQTPTTRRFRTSQTPLESTQSPRLSSPAPTSFRQEEALARRRKPRGGTRSAPETRRNLTSRRRSPPEDSS